MKLKTLVNEAVGMIEPPAMGLKMPRSSETHYVEEAMIGKTQISTDPNITAVR